MDRITNSEERHSQPVCTSKVTDLQYDIAVGRRCATCKKLTEKCTCQPSRE